MDPKNKTDLILLGVCLILAGAVLGYTAFDAPPLAAPAVTYTPPETAVSRTGSGQVSSVASAAASSRAGSQPQASSKAAVSFAAVSSESDSSKLWINLNTATLEELMALCDLKIGIGQSIVQNIYDYRETYGPFRSPEELILVRGIGESRLALLMEYVYTETPDSGS